MLASLRASLRRSFPKGDPIRAFHFCRVTIQDDGLKVEMVKLNADKDAWEVGDAFTVKNQVLIAETPR